MEFGSIMMNNGEIFDGKKIGELTEFIINKFSEEGLSYDESTIVLEKAKDTLGEYCFVSKHGAKRKGDSEYTTNDRGDMSFDKTMDNDIGIRSLEVDLDKGILMINRKNVTEPVMTTLPGPDGWPLCKLFNANLETGHPEECDKLEINYEEYRGR